MWVLAAGARTRASPERGPPPGGDVYGQLEQPALVHGVLGPLQRQRRGAFVGDSSALRPPVQWKNKAAFSPGQALHRIQMLRSASRRPRAPHLHLRLELAEAVADRRRPNARRRVVLQHAELLGHTAGSCLHQSGASCTSGGEQEPTDAVRAFKLLRCERKVAIDDFSKFCWVCKIDRPEKAAAACHIVHIFGRAAARRPPVYRLSLRSST